MIPAPLEAQFIRARVAVEVTLHQPLPRNRVNVITGQLIGTMMARGKVHQYRVSVGNGVIYLAPASWLVDSSHAAHRQELEAQLDVLIANYKQELFALHDAIQATKTLEGMA